MTKIKPMWKGKGCIMLSETEPTVSIDTVFSLLATVLGGGLILTWLSLWTSTASIVAFGGDSSHASSFHWLIIAFGIIGAFARLLCASQDKRLGWIMQSRKAVVTAAAAAAASPLLVALTYLPEPSVAFEAVRIIGLCGAAVFGSVFLFTYWVNRISSYAKALMMPIVTASFLLFSLLYFTLISLPSGVLVLMSPALPLVACLCFVTAQEPAQDDATEEQHLTISANKSWVLLTPLALSAFFLGLIGQIVRALMWSGAGGSYPTPSSLYHEMGIFFSAVVLCIYVLLSRAKGHNNTKQIPGLICMFVVALGIIIPGVLSEEFMPAADFALGIGLGCFQIQICYYAALISRTTGRSAFATFGILYAPLELAGSIGLPVMNALVASSIMWSQVALVTIMILFLLIFIVLLPFFKRHDALFESQANRSAEHEPAANSSDTPGIDEQSLSVDFRAFEFTPREEDVVALLLQGRSLPFIQSELSISEGTAKTHLLHIYRKCGVHDRQEFLSLFR